jgi:anti-anti-sigma factor
MATAHARDEGPPAFGIEVVRRGRHARVTVRGELDIATAPALDRALIEQMRIGRTVTLDFRELTFIDGTGLGLLLRTSAHAHARRDGLEFAVLPGPRVQRLLDRAALHRSCAPWICRPTDHRNTAGAKTGAARPVAVFRTTAARARWVAASAVTRYLARRGSLALTAARAASASDPGTAA